ncbi:unnamed protein product [Pseudo-nitzschia multistriata]|uniref:Uncharacterized protein n=1 Tax=Pseudo-nitzschia multistriata TaxID=183589 RepID=A0A448Z143_9STRA|nr:unnamed protein product [Pseudo-nitzschia multistriata]
MSMNTLGPDSGGITHTAARRKRASSVASLARWFGAVCAVLVTGLVFTFGTASVGSVSAFSTPLPESKPRPNKASRTSLSMFGAAKEPVGEAEASIAIKSVVSALKKDSSAKTELGTLNKVENVLGFGSPTAGTIAVRFNASFRKGGKGFLGMGGGKAKEGEQRGTMVGQVKASVDKNTGKVLQCSVFRDLGYGRTFNLKTK